jgi:hypothetical protein
VAGLLQSQTVFELLQVNLPVQVGHVMKAWIDAAKGLADAQVSVCIVLFFV